MGMRSAARMPKLTRRSRILIMIALGVIVLLLAGPRLIDAYVDWLWFGELGYRSVFTTMLATRIVVCLVAGVVVGGIVFGGLALAYRTRPVFVPDADNDPVARPAVPGCGEPAVRDFVPPAADAAGTQQRACRGRSRAAASPRM